MLDWFMTVPGILVACGIVLLIIAVILFMLGNKKEKKAASISQNTDTNTNANNEVITNNEVSVVSATPVEEIATESIQNEVPGVIDFTPATNNVEGDLDLSLNNETPDLDFSIDNNEPDLDLSIDNNLNTSEVVEEPKTLVEEAPMVSVGGVDLLSSVGVTPVETVNNSETVEEPEIKMVEPTNDIIQPASVEMPTISIPDAMPTIEPTTPVVSEPSVEPVIAEEVKTEEPEIKIETPTMEEPIIPEPVITEPVVEPTVEPVAEEQPLNLDISAPLEQPTIEPQPATIDLQPAQVQVEEINVENN